MNKKTARTLAMVETLSPGALNKILAIKTRERERDAMPEHLAEERKRKAEEKRQRKAEANLNRQGKK